MTPARSVVLTLATLALAAAAVVPASASPAPSPAPTGHHILAIGPGGCCPQ